MRRTPRRAARALAAGLALALAGAAGAAVPEPSDWAAVRREAVRLLTGYIRIDTSNPPGHEIEGARYLARFFESEGIATRIYEAAPGRASVVARLRASAPGGAKRGAILLLSHIDVVPADPRAWSHPPFGGEVARGFVWGRGALDDKGPGVVHALAFVLLHRLGVPLARDVVFCATAAEETGGAEGARWMVENHWSELGPPAVVWNEGGASTRNPLLGDRVLHGIATAEKRALWIRLVAEGEGGHGSQPIPDSAPDRIVAALARIRAHPAPVRLTPTVAATLRRVGAARGFPLSLLLGHMDIPWVARLVAPRLERNRLTNAMIRDTIAVTGLSAGLKHNVIPRRAEARLDVRLLPDTDAAGFLAWLRRLIDDPHVRIEDVPDPLPAPGHASPVANELFEALEAELERELPGGIAVPIQTTGGTDSRYFRARGVPAYGYLPALLSEELVSSVHGVDERIPVAELERAVRVTYRTLLRLTR